MYTPIKRLFDLVLSLIAIAVVLPFMIPVMIGLKLTGEGYIFYFQKRVGFQNRPFEIWKFASMLRDSPNLPGGIITMRQDPRLTPMGSFLRKTKINELPQLVNVLMGDMSFVGPRPVMPQSFAHYPAKVRDEIYLTKPGITGIGSIIFRDEERVIDDVQKNGGDPWQFYTQVIYPYKGRLELWYQRNISFGTDVKIIFLTAWQIIFPQSNLAFRIFKDLPPRPAELLPGKTMTPSELEVAIQEEVAVGD
jgi:lipopolysaccharide/colanic/teichoic acid biosynthesis glycosyltransferase